MTKIEVIDVNYNSDSGSNGSPGESANSATMTARCETEGKRGPHAGGDDGAADESDLVHELRALEADAPSAGLAAAVSARAENAGGLALNDTNAVHIRVVELALNDTNDDADAGLLRATALAENVGGLDDADNDAGSGLETDAGFENIYVLAEKEVERGAESDVRRVRRSVDFDAHDDVVAGLVSAGPIETPSRWALETTVP